MKFPDFRSMDLIPASVWIILSILVIVASYELDLGSFRTPGSGLFPFLLGIILMFASLQLFVRSLRDIEKKKRKKEVGISTRIHYAKIGALVVVLAAYGLMLEILGFIVTAFLCIFFLFKVIGSEKLNRALIFAGVTVLFAYALFVIVLKVYMPSFPWRNFVKILF